MIRRNDFEPFEPRLLLASYYISPAGNDSLAGTSPAAAWKTITKANTVDLNPGDQLLFQGGSTFTAPAENATNRVDDAGFESGGFAEWNLDYDVTAGNSSINTTLAHVRTGTKSLRIGGSTDGGRGQMVTSQLQPNKTYALRMWAKLLAGSGEAHGGITFRNAGQIVHSTSFRIATDANFRQYTSAFAAPPAFDSVDVWITKDAGGSILYVDDVTLNESFGTLVFDSTDSGTPVSPVTIGSYGVGEATIQAGDGFGLHALNVSGLVVQNLNFAGTWNASTATGGNASHGVHILNRQAGNTKLPFIRVTNVDVSGFKWAGISVSGENGKSGFTDVRITDSTAHDNGDVGIRVEGSFDFASTAYSHTNIYVGNSKSWNNYGLPNKGSNSGNGILIGDTDGAIVERNVAWNNGALCNHTQGGPVGIWAWDSNAVYIQYNESYQNKTGAGSLDGGGFDLDGGCTNSFLQYNYSHDNHGAGYLIYQFTGARPMNNNTVRYNISQNDGRVGHYGGIYMGGGSGVVNTHVYNNSIYLSPTANTSIAAIEIVGVGSGNKFRNNIFVTTGGVRLLETNAGYATSSVQFQGNNWYSSGAATAIKWGATTYSSLAAWRTATGQERNGAIDVGLSVNTNWVSPGGGTTLGDASLLHTMTAYQLIAGSPMINTGLSLASFGISPGTRDYYGGTMPSGGATDIGAFESAPAFTGTAGNDQIILRKSPAGLIELYANTPTSGVPTLAWAPAVYNSYAISGTGGLDTVTLDLANGNPLPSGGATFSGSGNADNLTITGSGGSDTIALSGTSVTPGGTGAAFAYSGVGNIALDTGFGNDTLLLSSAGAAASASINLGSGTDTLAVSSGTYSFNSDGALMSPNLNVTVAAGATAIFNVTQHINALTVTGAARLAASANKTLVTKSLSFVGSGALDITDNAVVVDHNGSSPLGTWSGSAYTGLTGEITADRLHSTTAAFNATRCTIGIGEASDLLIIVDGYGAFAGNVVDATSTLIRFTQLGDVNLDQQVTGSDRNRANAGVQNNSTGYANGDFDYNGIVNADDVFYTYANYYKPIEYTAPIVAEAPPSLDVSEPSSVVETPQETEQTSTKNKKQKPRRD